MSPGLNVIVYSFAIQCAYNVISDAGIYGVFTFVPPELNVYHPSNVYPVFVGTGNSTLLYVYVAVNCPSPDPNVYTIPLILPFPVATQESKFIVCCI